MEKWNRSPYRWHESSCMAWTCPWIGRSATKGVWCRTSQLTFLLHWTNRTTFYLYLGLDHLCCTWKVSPTSPYSHAWNWWGLNSSCFRKQEKGFKRKGLIIREKSPLHQIKWKRIILDEAHNIKERSTNTAKAAFELQAEYRWCLSGTPLQNRVGELYSLVRFLGGDPFSYYFCASCSQAVISLMVIYLTFR